MNENEKEEEQKNLPPPESLAPEQVDEVFSRLPEETRMSVHSARTSPTTAYNVVCVCEEETAPVDGGTNGDDNTE